MRLSELELCESGDVADIEVTGLATVRGSARAVFFSVLSAKRTTGTRSRRTR